jgi:hypothetical protein
MLAQRLSLAAAVFCLATLPLVGTAADPPRAPQPPFTNATAQEWLAELIAVGNLRDNAFLYEEAAQDLSRRLAAWQGAEVTLNLKVVKVTKEAVICDSLQFGRIAVRNEQEPPVPPPPQGPIGNNTALRIGDVVPLELARRLRAGDMLVLDGIVAASDYQPGRAMELIVGRGRPSAVVSRSYTGGRGDLNNLDQYVETPHYPPEALNARAGGLAIVTVAPKKMVLATSAGNSMLDDAVMKAMRRIEDNKHLFPGEHRFHFTILQR